MENTLIQTSVFRTPLGLLDFLAGMLDDAAVEGVTQASILLNDDGLWECSYPVYTEETQNAA